jgi:hydroxyethylthiazole kinase-like uncharacterized protein yjeF
MVNCYTMIMAKKELEELVLTRKQVRRCDEIAMERFGIDGLVLMENAGGAAARFILSRLKVAVESYVLIFAGTGNNGGDGFVVARHLANSRVTVSLVICGSRERIKGDALANLKIVEKMTLPITWIESTNPESIFQMVRSIAEQCRAEIIVDALLGTGTTGELREPIRSSIEAINQLETPVIALDIPSGLDCDTGLPLKAAIHAGHTVTFAAMKKGFSDSSSKDFTGDITIASIGLGTDWLND